MSLSILVNNAFWLMNIISMHIINYWLFSISHLGILIKSSTATFVLYLVVLPFKVDTSGPNIFSVISIYSTLTRQLWTILCLISIFKFRKFVAPNMWQSFHATNVILYCRSLKSFLFYPTVWKLFNPSIIFILFYSATFLKTYHLVYWDKSHHNYMVT